MHSHNQGDKLGSATDTGISLISMRILSNNKPEEVAKSSASKTPNPKV
jgi:hypothetical protein